MDLPGMSVFNRFYQNTIVPNMGVFLTLIAQFFNALMVILCKLLISDKDFDKPMHPLQILFVRMSITYLFCIGYFMFYEKNPDFPFGPKGVRILLLLRAFGGFIGVAGKYWALLYLNVSDTITITFLNPTFSSFTAWMVLGETFTKVEAIGGFVAFFGVILIAKPSFIFQYLPESMAGDSTDSAIVSSNPNARLIGSGLALLSCCGSAIAMCSIRKISFNAHPLFMVSCFSLFTLITSFFGILLIPGLSFVFPHTTKQWILLIGVGLSGFIMQFLLTAGMQREKAARALTMIYTQLIYASIFDFIMTGKIPIGWSLLGEIIICCAVFSIVYFKEVPNSVPPKYAPVSTSEALAPDVENGIQLDSFKDERDIQDTDEIDDFRITDDESDIPSLATSEVTSAK